MKYLTLIRHAKAEAIMSGRRDFDRRLSERGHRDALRVGEILSRVAPPPEVVVTSSAVRALQTTAFLLQGGTASPAVEEREELYLCDPGVMWNYAVGTMMEYHEVWLVAHNPGISEALELFSGVRVGSVSTATAARIAFSELSYAQPNGILEGYLTPALCNSRVASRKERR